MSDLGRTVDVEKLSKSRCRDQIGCRVHVGRQSDSIICLHVGLCRMSDLVRTVGLEKFSKSGSRDRISGSGRMSVIVGSTKEMC